MRMRVFMKKLRNEIENENETKVYLESLDFEIEMRVLKKSDASISTYCLNVVERGRRRGLKGQKIAFVL